MKKLNFACFVHISCLVLVLTLTGSSAKDCGDAECKAPIANAYATLNYRGGGGGKVDLLHGEKVLILARNVGPEKHYLIRKANGAEGLAGRQFIRDTKILIKQDNLITIPDEADAKIEPSGTLGSNVVDGTTLSSQDFGDGSKGGITEEPPAVPVDEKTPELEVVPSANAINEQLAANSLPEPEVKVDAPEKSEPEATLSDAPGDPDEEDEEDEEGDEGEEDEAETDEESAQESGGPEQSEDIKVEQEAVTPPADTSSTESEEVKKDIDSEENKIVTEAEVDKKITDTEEDKKVTDTEEDKKDTDVKKDGENLSSSVEPLQQPSTVTPFPSVDEPEIAIPDTLDTTTSNPISEAPLSTDEQVSKEMEPKSETIEQDPALVDIVVDDPRVEIPVTEEPEQPPAVASDNQNVVEESPKADSALPQAPHGLLRGGLGSLLSHHHHHHHHHHGHHHHGHGHDHHHHHHHNHQHEPSSHEHEPKEVPFLGGLEQQPVEQVPPPRESVDSHSDPNAGENDLQQRPVEAAVPEDGYCDQQSCPQPKPAQPPTLQQHANGFHHPTVNSPSAFFEETIPRPEEQQQQLEQEEMITPPISAGSSETEDVDFATMFVLELFKLSDLILLLGITSFTLITFSLGHYLINKNRKEKPLIYKLNMVERDLMASHKENAMLKSDLMETKHKLTSIENNSFGSNDMVIALRQELEDGEQTKLELQEQIASLEKELENAAEAGLELNKMVAELLNQSGSDSIALTVDELQKQLNEQQQTILSMNTTLADKSRENSELQITLAGQSTKFTQDLEELQQTLSDLKLEKNNIEIELNNVKSGQGSQLEKLRKETSSELAKLTKDVKSFQCKWEDAKKAQNTAEAKVEALEECIKDIKCGNSNGTVDGLIDSAELKAQLAVLNKEKSNLQDRLQGEVVARQLLDDHVKIINEEISNLKKEYSQAEKDKLEAETRLEVLSSYFKDKETQLQKELSIKEAMWMQQQGETTSTVERIRLMQDEIQQLKSQNDKLRAEIEAQATAHKAQYTALETRSHDAWLAARQAERRLEESRNESSALRRKLTALGDVSAANTTTDGLIPNAVPPHADLSITAPSPIRVESPNAPPMMGLPPPPFMPPPFGPPFMPPFMPPPGPGEMRPAPLGRLMSPPPNRYSPSLIDNRDRYSPDRGRYSPDSRYDYSVMSNYETETDFSPPPSPPPHSRRSNYDRDRDRNHHDHRDRDRDMRERDGRTSGSGGGGGADRGGGSGAGYPKAFSPPSMRTTSPPIQDPRNKKYQGGGGGFSSGSQDSTATRKSGKQYKNSKQSA